MSGTSSVPIGASGAEIVAPTPQNTPLTTAPLASGLSRPTVPTIGEEKDDGEGNASDDNGPPHTPPETGRSTDPLGLGPAGHAAMLGIVQERLQGLMGRSSGYIENLPIGTKRKVEALKGVQVKWEDLYLQFKLESIELEKKYLEKFTPLYDRRLAIINGSAQPTEDELRAGAEQSLKDDEDAEALPEATPNEPGSKEGIESFWLTALQNHGGISELITERDEGALKYLVDIRYTHLEKPEVGFKLLFEFGENPYFENKILEKTYYHQSELSYAGDLIFDHPKGTRIIWKEDKDLTKEIEIKKQRNKNTNRTRLVRKAISVDSFFNFFDPPQPPSDEDLENDKYDEEELGEIDSKLELDYQIGEDFKEKVIPRAIDYFTGKALQYDLDEDGYSDEEEGEDEGSDDDGDGDDDDPDDDLPRVKKGPPAKGGKRTGAGGDRECPQQ